MLVAQPSPVCISIQESCYAISICFSSATSPHASGAYKTAAEYPNLRNEDRYIFFRCPSHAHTNHSKSYKRQYARPWSPPYQPQNHQPQKNQQGSFPRPNWNRNWQKRPENRVGIDGQVNTPWLKGLRATGVCSCRLRLVWILELLT